MPPEPFILARRAMNTRFELVLPGTDTMRLRAAAEEAMTEISRIEAQLSLFIPTSEIARVNATAAAGPVRVSPEVFALLQRAARLSEISGGAFDITLAPLLDCWGLLGRSDGRIPSDAELAQARSVCGMGRLEFDATRRTVRFQRPGMTLDLGAIGKGYAVERAAELLRDAGIESALLHGGTSTVFALGHPPDAEAWKIALPAGGRRGDAEGIPATVRLRDESLSVSAIAGKSFTGSAGEVLGHVLDPRTGRPSNRADWSAVILPSATETDALSTALLVLGGEGPPLLAEARPGIRQWVVATR